MIGYYTFVNLPVITQQLYGEFILTGLYSFEFVDENRNTIAEIFLMSPPKTKTVSEPTRSTTVPTLGGNYIVDGGNATKTITLTGDLYFPYIGSPDNPVARNNVNLENTISGLEEFIKFQWMLIRYRDYTMTSNGRMAVPSTIMSISDDISKLYERISKEVNDKVGALYDKIQVIIHDYDMNDHYYCRINNFTSSQSADKYIVVNYTIDVECHEPDDKQRNNVSVSQTKTPTNESIDITNTQINQINYSEKFSSIQSEIGFNSEFASAGIEIENVLEEINTENEKIQAGQSTALTAMPTLTANLINNINIALVSFINTFLSSEQKSLYETSDLTIDDAVSNDLWFYYNSLQKLKIQAQSLKGVFNSIVQVEELRYYSNADDYTLTEEQFDSDNSFKVENTTTFYYYTVMSGDTARTIAQRELKDQNEFVKILKLNDISENDFIDEILVGQKIKIPFPLSIIARGNDNLVYEADFNNSEKFLFGSDLSTDLNKKLQISETGDLLGKSGIENVFKGIESRLENLKGSMTVFQSNWGTVAIDDGNAPLLVKIDRYLTDVISQIQADPRVQSVKMDLKSLRWSGETITTSIKIFFIGTEETREVTI